MIATENFHSTNKWRPFLAASVVSGAATACAYIVPENHSATAVGLCFLAATYWLTLRDPDPHAAKRWGLSLGGLLDPAPLDVRRMVRDTARALGWTGLLAAVFFPPFLIGFRLWYGAKNPWAVQGLSGVADVALAHLLVIALPEEAFFRGYLQTALDQVWPSRRRILGASVGPAIPVTSLVFAIGHFLTAPDPGRLAVFFPSLVFGWLRARTGGIGAAVLFHAACNVFASVLSRGYGLAP